MAATGWTTANYFSRTSGVISSTPLTIALWFNQPNITTSGWAISLGNNGSSGFYGISPAGATAGDPIRAQVQSDTGTSGIADTSTGFSANTWTHAAAVFASTTSRTVYKDGGSATTDTASITDPTPDFTSIGVLRRSTVTSAVPSGTLIAEVGIWNVALTAEEVAALAAGVSPLMVRPNALVAYYPFYDATTPSPEWMGAAELTMTGTITAADHPRIILPGDDQWMDFIVGAAPPAAVQQYLMLMGVGS